MKIDYNLSGFTPKDTKNYRRFSSGDDLDTTTVNQVLGLPGLYSTFTAPQLLKLRIVAIVASVISILACVVGIYLVVSIDKRRKVFRHQLILFLMVFDLLKALILCIYPLIILIRNEVYGHRVFYNPLGWLTAFAIEGSDIAIFVFALHFGILIFKPNWKWLNRRTGNMEGGFYKWRRLMYPLALSIPAVLASLAFINFQKLDENLIAANSNVVLDNNNYNFTFQAYLGGYKPLSTWCYLPPYPYWYQIALAWGPRLFIIVMIWTIYIGIYVFVTFESRKIKAEIHEFRHVPSRQRTNISVKESPIDTSLYIINAGLLRLKNVLVEIIRLLKSFFFFRIDEDEEDYSEKKKEKTIQGRVRPESFLDFNNSASELSSRYAFTVDDVDIEDGYDSDNNNGLHILSHGHDDYTANPNKHEPTPYVNGGEGFKIFKPSKAASKNTNSDDEFYLTDNRRSSFLKTLKRVSSRTYPENYPNTFESSTINSTSNDINRGKNGRKTTASLPSSSNTRFWQNHSRELHSNPVYKAPLNDERLATNSALGHFSSSRADLEELVNMGDHVEGIKHGFQSEMYNDFKKRRDQIKRNLKSIFIYPLAYVMLWLFPFIVYCLSFRYEVINGPLVGIHYIATFMRPLNGLVDVFVFIFRELPWRYSWACIQTKELINRYRLKGEIGESDIMSLSTTPLGKKGWYYRGRWIREECWKYKHQTWKRVCWYIYRTVLGFFRNDYDYSDRCLDRAYWDSYYTMRQLNTGSTSSTKKVPGFTSDSMSSGSSDNTQEHYKNIIKIPIFWRIFHKLPLQEGIDLDELDRYIRYRNRNDDFVLPGLEMVLGNSKNNSNFKPNYSFTIPNGKSNFKNASATEKEHSPHDRGISSLDIEKVTNMDFTDITNETLVNPTMQPATSEIEELDLIGFLKSAPLDKK